MATILSVAPAARTGRCGWNSKQLTGPIRCPRNPSWYRIIEIKFPPVSIILINWLCDPEATMGANSWTASAVWERKRIRKQKREKNMSENINLYYSVVNKKITERRKNTEYRIQKQNYRCTDVQKYIIQKYGKRKEAGLLYSPWDFDEARLSW